MIRTLTISLVLVAACGGKKPEPATPDKHAEHGEGAEHEHEMANMPPELMKFHDVLAPRWHADKGPQRMKDTCAAIPDFSAGVTAIATAQPPAGVDGTKWTNSAGELAAAVSKLDETCKANDAAAFEVAFQKVHETFHGLMGAAGGHEGKDEHEHTM
jgi:hypothetical protein